MSLAQMYRAVSGLPFTVAFSNPAGWAVLDEVAAPADALVYVQLRPNGDVFIFRQNGVDEVVGTWVTGSGFDANDYDFQWQQLGNDPNWGPGDPSPNIWVNGGANITWGLEETGTAVNIASGTMLIRPAGGGATIDSAGISLNVDTTI